MTRLLARRGVLASGVGITPPPPPEGGAYAAAVMADSPFAYWRLDETAGTNVADEMENHDGTADGVGLGATGRVGTGAYFDGTADVDVGTLGSFGSALDDGFTVECWFRFSGIEREVLLGQINTGTANTSLFVMANRSASNSVRPGGIRVQVRGEGSAIRARHTDRTDLNDGRWHHFVATWEGPGNDLDLYVDGVLDNGSAEGTGTSATADLDRALTLGALNDRGTLVDHYTGRLDEVAIYDHVLTSTRVAAHYAERDEEKDDGDGVVATGGIISDIPVGGVLWRVHRFDSPGTDDFVVTTGGDVEYLIVGGGASGGWGRGGGGGAGGRRTNVGGTMLTVTPDTYTVTVGAGADPPAAITELGIDGDPSSVFGIEAAGGGGGGETSRAGRDGGSGGGGGGQGSQPGGDGNVPLVSPAQGNDGGAGNTATSGSARAGGGGGGAGEAGQDGGTTQQGGDGGDGEASTIEGADDWHAGGGGGGTDSTSGAGGKGGGGDGADSNADPGEAATGSGGGGSHSGVSGEGGSGVVIIRYPLEV